MLYQLPNGRVIYLSIEEYLSLSDQELHEMSQLEYGDEVSHNTFLSKNSSARKEFNEDETLDYKPEDDETPTQGPIDLKNLPEL